MADPKLAQNPLIEEASPAPRTKSNDDAPRSRSARKDTTKSTGSTDPAPVGNPRKLDFGNKEREKYSPRNIDPGTPFPHGTPFPPKQVAQLVATYEGKSDPMQGLDEAEGEATQKHNKGADEQQQQQKLHREAAADGYAAVEKADAAGYAAPQELAKPEELEPTQITKTNPFATPAATPKDETPVVAAQQLTPNPENIPPASSPTPTKRKKNAREDDKADDDEMEEDQGDPNTLAPEVQLRKIHQTLRKFSDRMANNEDSIEGQGRMIDEVAAKQ